MNNMEKFTVEEFKNYVLSQQSMGDVGGVKQINKQL